MKIVVRFVPPGVNELSFLAAAVTRVVGEDPAAGLVEKLALAKEALVEMRTRAKAAAEEGGATAAEEGSEAPAAEAEAPAEVPSEEAIKAAEASVKTQQAAIAQARRTALGVVALIVHARAKMTHVVITFSSPDRCLAFQQKFQGHAFVDPRGAEWKATVELALFALTAPVPDDVPEATYETDEAFTSFVERFHAPVAPRQSAEADLDRREAERLANANKPEPLTPLLLEVQARLAGRWERLVGHAGKKKRKKDKGGKGKGKQQGKGKGKAKNKAGKGKGKQQNGLADGQQPGKGKAGKKSRRQKAAAAAAADGGGVPDAQQTAGAPGTSKRGRRKKKAAAAAAAAAAGGGDAGGQGAAAGGSSAPGEGSGKKKRGNKGKGKGKGKGKEAGVPGEPGKGKGRKNRRGGGNKAAAGPSTLSTAAPAFVPGQFS